MEREQKFHLDIPLNCPPLPNSRTPSSAAPAPAAKSDASRTTIVYASPPSLLNRSRGEKLGEAFATLNSDDFARADAFVGAIERGARNAAAETAHVQAVSESPDALRELGFWGVDNDEW